MARAVPGRNVKLKRAYERPTPRDGVRVLVDRLWPRGLKKSKGAIDRWDKEVAPSSALRKWFGHDPARWREFSRRYVAELRRNPEPVERLRGLAREKPITLVFAARDETHAHAVVLRKLLLRRPAKRKPKGAST
jgi:uncharacterized protein YeaO (DUF488 family)